MLPYLSTALVASWVTRSFWWPGRYVVSFDTYTYSGPNTAVTEQALRAGRLPLWNDAIFGGVTHLGNPQAGALYPPRLITLLLEDNRAMGLLVALHVVLLGLGIVAFVRRLGLLPLAAAFAGAAAVLNGAVLTRSIQFEQILVIAWAPWLLTAIHAALSGARPRLAAAAIASRHGGDARRRAPPDGVPVHRPGDRRHGRLRHQLRRVAPPAVPRGRGRPGRADGAPAARRGGGGDERRAS